MCKVAGVSRFRQKRTWKRTVKQKVWLLLTRPENADTLQSRSLKGSEL